MTARIPVLAAFAAMFLAFALAGCAGSSAKAAKVSAAEADSLRTPFLLSWKAGNDAGAFDGALYTKKGFSRMELYGPMGVPVASVVWDRGPGKAERLGAAARRARGGAAAGKRALAQPARLGPAEREALGTGPRMGIVGGEVRLPR